MTYKLCKQLKKAGFPQTIKKGQKIRSETDWYDYAYEPTLSELIEAVSKKITSLTTDKIEHWFELYWITMNNRKKIYEWGAGYSWGENRDFLFGRENFFGKTPEIAVAKLYLKLNQ